MKKRILLPAFALLLSQLSFAGNRSEATTITLSDAPYFFAAKRHINNINMPNAAIAYNFDNHWAVEFGAGLINTNQRRFNQHGIHGFLYTLDGLYRLDPHGALEPYLLAGIGIMGLTPNGNDSEYQGNVNAGVGTQWFCDRSIALRGELRDVYTLHGGKNDIMLNFGISFLFGGK